MKSQLSPEAPVYIPPPLRNVTNTTPPQKSISPFAKSIPTGKEPQCSRYSRKSVRQVNNAFNSPRPILGTKCIFPRPILGRKSDDIEDEAEEHIGKEFRSISRNFYKLKLRDEQVPSENIEDGC